jgi:hypothetical protein
VQGRSIGGIATALRQIVRPLLRPLFFTGQRDIHRADHALPLQAASLLQDLGAVQHNRPALLLQVHAVYLWNKAAPFLEKYTNLSYGKRKTWIIISQLICACILLGASFFTEVTFASLIALLLMSSELFLTIQDISLDSLSIKETRSPERASMIQSIAQPFGTVIGSLVLLKFTSD